MDCERLPGPEGLAAAAIGENCFAVIANARLQIVDRGATSIALSQMLYRLGIMIPEHPLRELFVIKVSGH